MLVKLIKHEWKFTYRFMLLLYGLLWTTSILSAITIRFELFDMAKKVSDAIGVVGILVSILSFTSVLLFLIMNIIVIAATYFYAIFRFKNTLLENEGYLMHTLPVKTSSLLLSKTIISVGWNFISILAILLSYLILLFGAATHPEFGHELILTLKNLSRILQSTLADTPFLLYGAEMLLASVFATIASYLQIFASMSIGFSANKNRILKSIGIYILCSTLASTIESILAVMFLGVSMFYTNTDIFSDFGKMLWIEVLAGGIYVLVYYLIAKHFLTKKLNLL